MTAEAFRRMALAMSGAVEAAHMGHPDFRANGKIFATLQSAERGMVKLTPEQQGRFVAEAWGRQGCTRVYLQHAQPELVGEAMTLAWQQVQGATKKRTAASRPRR
jgi:hypothetical protein